jgi:hypothetical protein
MERTEPCVRSLDPTSARRDAFSRDTVFAAAEPPAAGAAVIVRSQLRQMAHARRLASLGGIPHPGTTEIGWLTDLKATAERVGSEVMGRPIRWDVENALKTSAKRPDVIIRWDTDGSVIANGEAKRPNEPSGLHPLITTEVDNALRKAATLSSPLCFTTNFLHAAVFSTAEGSYNTIVERMKGELISIVDERLATGADWWHSLTTPQRNAAVESGLRALFERLHNSLRSRAVAPNVDEVLLVVFRRTTDQMVSGLAPMIISAQSDHTLPASVINQAADAGFKSLDKANDARFLAAQAVAEVLTAALFHQNVRGYFSLPEMLGGTEPAKSALLAKRVTDSLVRARQKTGDYDTIFNLSPAAQWALGLESDSLRRQWIDLFNVVERIALDEVTSDVLGSIFERLISPDRRREMGQHYTQNRVAQAMVRWAVRSDKEVVADISCGAGTFLVEAYKVLIEHGRDHQEALGQLLGNDLDPFAVHLATVNLATRDIYKGANYPAVKIGDALELRPGGRILSVTPADGASYELDFPSGGVDVAVGNPPYDEKSSDPARFSRVLFDIGGADALPKGLRNGNLAAWFFLLNAALVKPDGRIALVLPNSVIQNPNLQPFRRWLRSLYDLVIWHTESDIWFSDARVAPIVLMATPRSNGTKGLGSVHFVNVLDPVSGELVEVDGVAAPSKNVVIRNLSACDQDADLMIEGTQPEVLTAFTALSNTERLGGLPGVAVFSGNKLGHDFYKLADQDTSKPGVTRRLKGYGIEISLSTKYLVPLLSGPRDERSGEYQPDRTKVWVLDAPEVLPAGGSLAAYVSHARKVRVPDSPSVQSRGKSWWSAKWKTSNIAVQIHPGFEHQVWWCDNEFVANNNFHILEMPKYSRDDRELISASLASAFGALSSLYKSSEVGCEGVRWLQTGQLATWPVLNPSKVPTGNRDTVLAAYRVFRKRDAVKLHDLVGAALDEFTALSEAVAEAAGASDPKKMAATAVAVAKETTARRQGREATALQGRTKASTKGGGKIQKDVRLYIERHPMLNDVIGSLTNGQAVKRLRRRGEVEQQSMLLDGWGDEGVTDTEDALTYPLGLFFDAAPQEIPYTVEIVTQLFDETVHHFVPVPPDEAATGAYRAVYDDIIKTLRSTLQKLVSQRLN